MTKLVLLGSCRPVPPELSTQHGQLPGKLKGIQGMPGLTAKMEAIHSQVQSLLKTKHQANEQGVIDQAQLDEWRDAVARWPISNLQHPLSFNRPASWAPPGLNSKSRPSTTPEQATKVEEKAPAPNAPPNPSDECKSPGVYSSIMPTTCVVFVHKIRVKLRRYCGCGLQH